MIDDLDEFIDEGRRFSEAFAKGIERAERRHARRVRTGRVLHFVRWHGWCLPRRCKVSARIVNDLVYAMRRDEHGH